MIDYRGSCKLLYGGRTDPSQLLSHSVRHCVALRRAKRGTRGAYVQVPSAAKYSHMKLTTEWCIPEWCIPDHVQILTVSDSNARTMSSMVDFTTM